MIRICIVCEGQTEVEFVKSCLAPYLLCSQVLAFPSLLQAPSGNHRGGRVTVERLVKFISHQYHQADRITTLVDFYGFQDRGSRSRAQLEADIRAGVEGSTTGYDRRFVLPYVQMHEFEGLLFTNPGAFEWVSDGWSEDVKNALTAVAQGVASPEDINDSPESAPSKRILRIFPEGTYSKTEHGPLIAEAIGIDAIRRKCPQFDAWVAHLQAWGY
ncbi:DUF4276 family protein [Allochromatium humboldtianum]|uniref:DUF4276 family protein n=1 Tax=Allochromatium humboldtianum TaxID=504901 RepID=A0A850R339_9GAMM|nr:DUF4276 family protein [Allochromatium humboldtianum]NVZ08044.1 DUF4276 family protein [Allochromatium humboldtianum]